MIPAPSPLATGDLAALLATGTQLLLRSLGAQVPTLTVTVLGLVLGTLIGALRSDRSGALAGTPPGNRGGAPTTRSDRSPRRSRPGRARAHGTRWMGPEQPAGGGHAQPRRRRTAAAGGSDVAERLDPGAERVQPC